MKLLFGIKVPDEVNGHEVVSLPKRASKWIFVGFTAF